MSQALLEPSLLALLLLFPLFLLLALTKRAISKKINLPPSPPKLPFIGNLHQLGSLPHRSLRTLSMKHGPLMLLHIGRVPTLVVSSAELAREIMKTHDQIFASRPPSEIVRIMFHDRMDMGFAPYGAYWRQARKLCATHLLGPKMVQSFQQAREEEVAFLISKISPGLVNMSEILKSFANDIITRVVSGKFSREEGRNEVFAELIEENSALFGAFHVADYFPMLGWLDIFFGLKARAKRNGERWDDVLDEVLKDHADRLEGDGPKNTDFVDVLLSLRKEKDPNMEFALGKEDIKALLNA